MTRPPQAADPAELDAFLAANPATTFVDLFVTNLSGVARGKRLRRADLAAAYAGGLHLPGSIMVVDVTGLDLDEADIWPDGDGDRLAWPIAGTLTLAPWLGPDAVQAMLGLYEIDGSGCEVDPRLILQRVVDRFAADGLTPVVACELEFLLLDAERTVTGGIQHRRGSDGQRAVQQQVFGLEPDHIAGDYLRTLWTACDAIGVPAGSAIAEYAPGQLELTLAHRPDAVAACDDAVRFKRAAKGVAAAQGFAATFMAKPFAALPGNGLHFHISVLDADGHNIFAADAPEGSAALRYAVGGACETMGDAMAIFAPNANSYRRFGQPGYTLARAGWGLNKRTVAVRIPRGPAASRRLEHRVCGADANPYLAVAAVLAGIHHGLTARIDPGPPLASSGFGGDDAGTGERLPSDWAYAIERCARSRRLRDYLGARAIAVFAAVKRGEQARFDAVVPPLDYDWLLRSA